MQDQLTQGALVGGIAVFVFKEIWSIFKDSTKDHIKALAENTVAVTKLTVKMEYLEKAVEAIPELQKDLAALGAKVRSMSSNGPL